MGVAAATMTPTAPANPPEPAPAVLADEGDSWVLPQVVLPALVSLLVCTIGIFGYHHFLGKKGNIATVDLQSVFDAKQLEFSELALKKSATDDDRARALDMASAFPEQMLKAVEKISKDCNCTLVVRSAVVGSGKPDYTRQLLAEFGLDDAKMEGVKKRLQRQLALEKQDAGLPSAIGR